MEEIGFDNYYGMSLSKLPKNVYNAMSFEFNTDILENKKAMLWIKRFVKRNINKFERGLSPSYLSNGGNDFLEVSQKLGCSTFDIISYIDIKIDEILGFNC